MKRDVKTMVILVSFFCLIIAGTASAKSTVEVIRPTKIPKTVGTFCTVHNPKGHQMVFFKGRFSSSGKLTSPHTITFVNTRNARRSFAVSYGPNGSPRQIKFADRSILKFKEVGKRVEARLYNKKGKLIATDKSFISDSKKIVRTRIPKSGKVAVSPFRLNWRTFSGVTQQDLENNFGPALGKSLGELLDKSFDSANAVIERASSLAGSAGNVGAQLAIVLNGYIADGLGAAAEKTEKKDIKFFKDAFDLTQSIDAIKDFFKAPSIGGVPTLTNSLTDLVNTIADQPLAFEVHVNPKGKTKVEEIEPTDKERLEDIQTLSKEVTSHLSGAGSPYTLTRFGTLGNYLYSENAAYQSHMAEAINAVAGMATLLNAFDSQSSEEYAAAYGLYKTSRKSIVQKLDATIPPLVSLLEAFEDSIATLEDSIRFEEELINAINSSPATVAAARQRKAGLEELLTSTQSGVETLQSLIPKLENLKERALKL